MAEEKRKHDMSSTVPPGAGAKLMQQVKKPAAIGKESFFYPYIRILPYPEILKRLLLNSKD